MRNVPYFGWVLSKRAGKTSWEVKVTESGKPDEYFEIPLFFLTSDDGSPARLWAYLQTISSATDGAYGYIFWLESEIYALQSRATALETRVTALEAL